MDGHEATRRIKATPQGRSTVIIALTATAFEEDRDQILAEGCDDFVRKPFREDEIVDKLAHHLGARFLYEGAMGLAQAAIEADAGRIIALAEQMREPWPAVASALASLANDFDYEAILSAIQER